MEGGELDGGRMEKIGRIGEINRNLSFMRPWAPKLAIMTYKGMGA